MEWNRFSKSYAVSDHGIVYSYHRNRRLKPMLSGQQKYEAIAVCEGGVQSRHYVHHLVAAAFLGPQPPDTEVAHLDGNNRNNKASNLAYVTHAENEAHKQRHGTSSAGDRNGMAKFSWETVRQIRALKGQMPQAEIARRLGVSPMQVSRIIRNKSWRVTDEI